MGDTGGAEPPATPDYDVRAMVDRLVAELEDHPGHLFLVIDELHELRGPLAAIRTADPHRCLNVSAVASPLTWLDPMKSFTCT